jgi:formate hydrogenlyase subunit 3/multisubunit Na+/H+ antiporter MnhD subunit
LTLLSIALACWFVGAIGAWLFRRGAVGTWLGVGGPIAGGAAGTAAALEGLSSVPALVWQGTWSVPGGTFGIRLDPLAAFFLLPIAVIGALCAIYGVEYLRQHAHGRPIGGALAAYNALVLSMAMVVTASDMVLFLVAWELMTLSSWALVVYSHEERAVRVAGLEYLVAAHLATIALFLLAVFLAAKSGSFAITALVGDTVVPRALLFVLALIGFGTKAGIVPLHVWLPDAHPAAPSHVSALMSAVMITMGFYGLARFIPLLGPPELWWAYLLLTLGSVGAVGGVSFAIVQRDVKRILAYSTVENAGIVTIAIGLGLLAAAVGQPALAGIAWMAALLHIWNHAFAKALLFLGFGAVAQAARSRNLDALGGILRRWRVVGSALVIGAAAMASLPGLNIFTGEWLLLRGLFQGVVTLGGAPQVVVLCAIGMIAFTGGIAVLCFVRLVGIGLLGTPRTVEAADAPSPGWAMRVPMLVFAAVCVLGAALPARIGDVLANVVSVVAPTAVTSGARTALEPLAWLLPVLAATVFLIVALRSVATRTLARRQASTWGCGYDAPTAAMQYSSTSFSEPLATVMHPLLHTTTVQEGTLSLRAGTSPVRWTSFTEDIVLAGVYLPLFAVVRRASARVRALHTARVTTSLLYVVGTVVALLALSLLPGLRQ